MKRTYRLLISCPDASGIVAAVTQFIACYGGWIVESNNHSDPVTGRFYMRNEIMADSLDISADQFRELFTPVAEKLELNWWLTDSEVLHKVALLEDFDTIFRIG